MATSNAFRYDPELIQSNTSSRAATHRELDPALIQRVQNMQVHEIMSLAEKAGRDFQVIHENIRNFYAINGGISPSQKATMATFLIQHPELLGENPTVAEPVATTATGFQIVQPPPEQQSMHIAAGQPVDQPKVKSFGGVEAEYDDETGAYTL